ncbi:Protein of unknown function [Lactobacillus equicursoris 66c]|uniref:Uncharacterized protein n=1 Tax=Lactobacillus equicursoris 66c TaxID=872326 RepID=K0NQ17_9LACO|nr:Protein of unknown function [Lactobacillus equicursoris 66c]
MVKQVVLFGIFVDKTTAILVNENRRATRRQEVNSTTGSSRG